MRFIEVVEYREEYTLLYEKEAKRIRTILGSNSVDVQHIGSTSVPGLSGKPTVDMLVVVKSLEEVDERCEDLTLIGYEAYGEYGIPGRRFFVRGNYVEGKGYVHLYHVHVFSGDDAWNITRHIAVREYLRAHREKARAYASLKSGLASAFPHDPDGYSAGKGEFVQNLQEQAVKWFQKKKDFGG